MFDNDIVTKNKIFDQLVPLFKFFQLIHNLNLWRFFFFLTLQFFEIQNLLEKRSVFVENVRILQVKLVDDFKFIFCSVFNVGVNVREKALPFIIFLPLFDLREFKWLKNYCFTFNKQILSPFKSSIIL